MIVELYSKRVRVLKLEQTANSQCDGMAVHQMCESSRQIQTASSQCSGTAVHVQKFNSSQCDIAALQQIPSNSQTLICGYVVAVLHQCHSSHYSVWLIKLNYFI